MPSKRIQIPAPIESALAAGATLLLSISGGKDSQAMSSALLRLHQERGWSGEVVMAHADLGQMERTETRPFVTGLARAAGLELYILENDLLEHIEARYNRLLEQGRGDVVPFPDAKNRYCTSDLKRNPINKWIRNQYPQAAQIVCAMGLRADESRARAKRPVYELRRGCNAPTKERIVYDWNPIHDWTEADVWAELGYSLEELLLIQWACKTIDSAGRNPYAYLHNIGFTAHPAYALGNERLSCAMCILGCKGDLLGGAQNQPETYRRLVQLELDSGKSFRVNLWLASLAPQL